MSNWMMIRLNEYKGNCPECNSHYVHKLGGTGVGTYMYMKCSHCNWELSDESPKVLPEKKQYDMRYKCPNKNLGFLY